MLVEHAKRELGLVGLFDEDSDYGGMIGEAIMELMKVFAEQGHSGASAPRVASLFKELANYNCLAPLTGKDSEWNDVDHCFQNNRVSSVFKEKEDGSTHYIEAIIWKEQTGSCFTGTVDGVSSSQNIKSFPFKPKTFYVDVISKETKPGWWDSHIKDKKQLEKVWEVYDKREATK